MKPFFLTYKSINITWFMALAVMSIIISYLIVKNHTKEYKGYESEIDDGYFILLIVGFIGARLTYVMFNFGLFKDNFLSIFKLSHYNLSLIGGVLFSILALLIISKRFKIAFNNLIKIYIIPFYFSMAIGIWSLAFDGFIVANRNGHMSILLLSLIFLLGMILESILSKRTNNKYTSLINLALVMGAYYVVKFFML